MSTLRDVIREVRDAHPSIADPNELAPLVVAAWRAAGMADQVLLPAAYEMITEQQRGDAARNLSRGSAPRREYRPSIQVIQGETRTIVPKVTWITQARQTQLRGNGRWIRLDAFTVEDCAAYAEMRDGQAVSAAKRAEQMRRVSKALEHAGVATVAELDDDVLSDALDGEIPA